MTEAGWQGLGAKTIKWHGTLEAEKFSGDGSGLTGITVAETDPNFASLSGGLAYLPTTLSGSLAYIPTTLSAALISYATSGGATVSLGAHVADISDPHGTTITQTNAKFSGIFSAAIGDFSSTLSGAKFVTTADQSSSGTSYHANILYDTNATPPTASSYPIGSIYIQYTA